MGRFLRIQGHIRGHIRGIISEMTLVGIDN